MCIRDRKVEELSIIDGLTGVYNRNYLKYRVEEKKKQLIFPFTVIMSDCNYLKEVNDQFGHESVSYTHLSAPESLFSVLWMIP